MVYVDHTVLPLLICRQHVFVFAVPGMDKGKFTVKVVAAKEYVSSEKR